MAETVDAQENRNWNDVVPDTLFGTGIKVGVLAGFSLLAVARIAMVIVLLTTILDGAPGSLISIVSFMLVDLIGSLILAGALVWAATAQTRLPDWARVTLLSVSAVVLVGSGALSLFGIPGLLN